MGNHELYLIRGTDIEPSIVGEERDHYKWVKSSLTEREIKYIKSLPLYYEINIDYDNKKIVLCHYLIRDEKAKQPFEKSNLKKDIDLWIKYNNSNTLYVVGHLHKSFDVNEVDSINGHYLEAINGLTNIEVVGSAGCSYDEFVSYLLIEIDQDIKLQKIKVKFDREKFISKVKNTNFPDKKNILKWFYNVE